MTIRIVGDLVTVRGLGFIGIPGAVVESADEARNAIRKFLEDEETGLVLVSQTIAYELGNEFENYKLRKNFPLVMNIPDSKGQGSEAENIQEMIQKALGVKL